MPMSSCSNGTSSAHKNGMEGEVAGGCVCKLPKKKKKIKKKIKKDFLQKYELITSFWPCKNWNFHSSVCCANTITLQSTDEATLNLSLPTAWYGYRCMSSG